MHDITQLNIVYFNQSVCMFSSAIVCILSADSVIGAALSCLGLSQR